MPSPYAVPRVELAKAARALDAMQKDAAELRAAILEALGITAAEP